MIAIEDYGLIGRHRACAHIDDGDVVEDEQTFGGMLLSERWRACHGKREQRSNEQKRKTA